MYLQVIADPVQYHDFVSPACMKSRDLQFWILMIASCIVFALYMGEILASHSIIKEQRFLQEQNQTASAAPYYKDAWQKLAVEVWKGAAQDPAMQDLLKSEGIDVRQGAPPGAEPASTNAAPASPTPVAAAPPPAPAPQPAHP
jgi:hypothetical protein